jgi:radical SAM superfamily enzyme YgiQ (UPF0313 family)
MLKTDTAKVDLSLEIEVALANFFKSHIEESKEVGKNYERLWRELERLIRSGGKRTRPKIMLLESKNTQLLKMLQEKSRHLKRLMILKICSEVILSA